MSLRLRLLRLILRGLVRPRLARTATPDIARRDFELAARLSRPPPFLLHCAGKPLHRITAGPFCDEGVILWFHGGAYVAGSPSTHAAMLGRLARLARMAVYCPDYRKAPEHPAPAAFEDAQAAHAALLGTGWAPSQIVLGGDSAGGGLALALLAALCRCGQRPGGIIALSPWTDLSLSGPSIRNNAHADPLLPASRIAEAVEMVRGTLDPRDPRLSPLFAAFDAPPPALILVGSDEILLDDATRMAAHLQSAGGRTTMRIVARAPHVWPIFDGWIPEARAALRDAAGFARAHAGIPDTSL